MIPKQYKFSSTKKFTKYQLESNGLFKKLFCSEEIIKLKENIDSDIITISFMYYCLNYY